MNFGLSFKITYYKKREDFLWLTNIKASPIKTKSTFKISMISDPSGDRKTS